jgi:arabinose-5-phosphate isomerase
MLKSLKNIIQIESLAIQQIPINDSLISAIDLIYHRVHKLGGKVMCSGMGKAGHIATNIAMTLSSTGTPAGYLHPSEAQHGDLGILQKDDVLLLISNSGKTREVVELIHLSKLLYPTMPIIVITKDADTELAKLASVVLLTGNTKEVCPLGLTPTTSITVITVIGDLLIWGVMTKLGFTAADYAKRHHSGYLGQKSKNMANQHN